MKKLSRNFGWGCRLLLVANLGVMGMNARAAEYGPFDMRKLLVPNVAPATGAKLDIRFLDTVLNDLRIHAGNYPVKFDSPRDKQRAQQDATALIGVLGAAYGSGEVPPEMLLRLGTLGAMAHNLDVPQGAAFAQIQFMQLLKAQPEHPLANYQYGTFLASSGRASEALPYLLRAKDKGVAPAMYGLGMTYLALGDKGKALENLSAYQKLNPADESISNLVAAIRGGTLQIKQEKASAGERR